MFKNLIGIDISPLRSAMILSYIGGLLLITTALTFALPSTWIIFEEEFHDVKSFVWVLFAVGIARILFTYIFARGVKLFFYLIILGSLLKVLELPLAASNESVGFAIWYVIVTGIPEILLLINIFNPKAREELKF